MTPASLARVLAQASVAVAAGASAVSAQRVTYDGGVSVTSGSYIFSDPATAWTLSTGLSLAAGPVRFRIGIPVSFQNSTLIATGGVGPVPTGGSSSGVVADSGRARRGPVDGQGLVASAGPAFGAGGALAEGPVEVPATAYRDYFAAVGDPVGQLSWQVTASRTSFSASGMVKAPVSDTSMVGTGQWDAGVSAGIWQRLGQWGAVGLDASYWWLGDLPDLELRDPVLGTASVIAFLGNRWTGGLNAQASTAILEGYDPAVSVGLSIARVLPGRILSLNVGFGLTETAPDLSAGIGWSIPIAGSD